MDIKAYIDYFSEIADLPRDRQFTLLEQAQQHAAKRSFLFRTGWLELFAPGLCIGILAGLVYLFTSSSPWLYLAAAVVGLLLARVLIKEHLNANMRKGLHIALRTRAKHKKTPRH